jgi:hypothetical protein
VIVVEIAIFMGNLQIMGLPRASDPRGGLFVFPGILAARFCDEANCDWIDMAGSDVVFCGIRASRE